MKAIRSLIMSRKVQWSITRCAQCSHFAQACDLPCLVPCHRICILIKGRLYYRWLCKLCIERIWGIVSRLCKEQTPEVEKEAAPLSTAIDQPFKRGAALGSALLARGILDHLDLANAQGCHALACRYAESAYPHASRQDQPVLVAGILHAWAMAHTRGEGMR